ncbi:hypothetical protein [Winslowiella iniecta]|nr:hypothetical protein [Winslowiella iniecta]
MSNNEKQQGNTEAVSKGIPAKVSAGSELYFHPGSATFLLVPGGDHNDFVQEQDLLSRLIDAQLAAKAELEKATDQCIDIVKVNKAKAESLMKQAYDKVNQTTEELRNALAELTPEVSDAELLSEGSKDSGIGIMELIPMSKKGAVGFKKTYVRSNRIRNHWRTYKLSGSDNKGTEDSFFKKQQYTTYVTDENGNRQPKTRERSVIDTAKLKEKYSEVERKIKTEFLKDEFDKLETNVILSSWAKKMNEAIKESSDSLSDSFNKNKNVDLSAQAQLMRFTSGVGLESELNPMLQNGDLKLKANASFVLGEAKAEAAFHFPDKVGREIKFPLRAEVAADKAFCAKNKCEVTPNGTLGSVGFIKLKLTIEASGSIGASLAVEAGISLDTGKDMGESYGIRGSRAKLKLNQLPGVSSSDISVEIPDAKAGGELAAFAGVEVGGNIAGALQWKPPELSELNEGKSDDDKDFRSFAEIKPEFKFQAGAGGGGTFYVTFVSGRFRIYCKAGLCWGVGAKGSIGFEVSTNTIYDFFEFFIYLLRNIDYQKALSVMAVDAYKTFCTIPLIAISKGVDLGKVIVSDAESAYFQLYDSLCEENKRVRLMVKINQSPEVLKYTPPESKGAVIYMLMDNSGWDYVDPRNQNYNVLSDKLSQRINVLKFGPVKLRKQAIFNSLRWVQSKSDYRNVMQHISARPADDTIKSDWKGNEKKVIEFLSEGEVYQLGELSTQYGKKLAKLYNDLPDGHEVSPDDELREIPSSLMDEYLAIINEQEDENNRIA